MRISISRFQNIFRKGYEQTFSDEIFTVIKVNDKIGIHTFSLVDQDGIDIEGQYYLAELAKVNDGKQRR